MILTSYVPDFDAKLKTVHKVWSLAVIFFDDNTVRASFWMESPNVIFDGYSPMEMCLNSESVGVVNLLKEMIALKITKESEESN